MSTTPKRTRATLSALLDELGAEKTPGGYRLHGYDVYRSLTSRRREWCVTYKGRASTTPKRSATDALLWVQARHLEKMAKARTGPVAP
jgi:hypothetical protein